MTYQPGFPNLRLFYIILSITLCFSCRSNAAKNYSGVSAVNKAAYKATRLANLGMIWGFLKYYHPDVAKGNYDWDQELFDVLPDVLAAANDQAAYTIIESWVNDLNPVPVRVSDNGVAVQQVKLQPDFGPLFSENNLPASLASKLVHIRDNYTVPGQHKYIEFAPEIGNPVFTNELAYETNAYPDAGLRLLALYRYWNMIQYFYPYRHLIGEDWYRVLNEFIPRFIDAQNKEEYTLACLELVGRVHDSHAGISSKNPVLNHIKGKFILPFRAAFIEDKLVVTAYYQGITDPNKDKPLAGDIVEQINGISVDSLVQRYLPLTPASNYETQLRDMTGLNGFLLRSNYPETELMIRNDKGTQKIRMRLIPVPDPATGRNDPDAAYKMLPGNIGYIYPGLLSNKDFVTIRDSFARTRGIIIDFRCYPSVFMPFTYGQWFKGNSSSFAYFTKPGPGPPGSIVYTDTAVNGLRNPDYYPGKIVIIVNARTQSQAEYSTMALSTAYRVTVLGSTTAGADGNVSRIVLPGDIQTMISGLGVYYPDGTETQRSGIKIDIPARPSIDGIRAGKDELLDKAIELITRSQ